VIGCGTCPAMLHTGGKDEVIEMKSRLEQAGKEVTGWMVIPTACDSLTKDAMEEEAQKINAAQAILVMSCAYGVQTVGLYTGKAVYPALESSSSGKRRNPVHLWKSVPVRQLPSWRHGDHLPYCAMCQGSAEWPVRRFR